MIARTANMATTVTRKAEGKEKKKKEKEEKDAMTRARQKHATHGDGDFVIPK